MRSSRDGPGPESSPRDRDTAPNGPRSAAEHVQQEHDQARRLDAEHAAREAAEAAGRRTEFLARVSETLASSLDYETTLRAVADLSVPEIADWCAVDLVEDGDVRRLAVAHVDPAKVAFARELQTRYPPDPSAPRGVHNVIRTGVSEMMEEIPQELMEAAAVDDEHRRILRELGLRSYVSVPLVARGQVLGALSVIYAESGRRYTPTMLLLLEDLGRRAGTAIDNARLVRDLEEQSRLLAVALRTRAEFIATVSHELRTPLNAIMGYTQLIEMGVSGPVSEPAMEHVLRIGQSARQLLQLIDDILTFSALESNRESTQFERVRVAELIDEVRAVIEPVARRAGLDFHVDADDAPAVVETDSRKLRQILLNLLGNAVKFTPAGSVTLGVHQHGAIVEFVVADTGMGIPQDEQARLFEPYWQSSEARSRGIGGAGLGLSISQRFAHLLGGALHCDSIAGRGTTFTLRLPAPPARQEAPL